MMRPVTLAAVLLIGTAATCRPALATDDGYLNVFSSVLGAVGLMPEEHSPPIDYRERAPLVLPPKKDLVTPEPAGIHRTAAWPQDPDVLARRQAEEDAKAPMATVFDKRLERPDSKTEMLKHRAAQTDLAVGESCRMSEHADAHCRVGPDEMRREDALFRANAPKEASSDVVTAGVEPEREYLTQPPKGYLKATKTVHATAEAPRIDRDMSKPLSTLLPHNDPVQDSPNN